MAPVVAVNHAGKVLGQTTLTVNLSGDFPLVVCDLSNLESFIDSLDDLSARFGPYLARTSERHDVSGPALNFKNMTYVGSR